ncbi:MAG: 50S ribosomal protein L29 [Candidatus Bathyarchaeia archaeon]
MPLMRMKEIRDLTEDEIQRRLSELRAELFKLRGVSKAGGAVENPGRIREIRKTIARILTIQAERKRGKAD